MISMRGSSRVIAVTSPAASASTASRQIRTAAGSPESTAFAQSAASASGSPDAAAQARLTAEAEARVSRQPRCPQPQSGPSGRTTMWPISPAYPCAPASMVPVMPMAPAIPVPSGTKRKRSAPLPAPIRPSARPPVLTSWPSATGTPPSRLPSFSRIGTSRQPRFAA